MQNNRKGLLSDCEHLFTPLTFDQEGHLKGGFATMSGNALEKRTNISCKNTLCSNQECMNKGCLNTSCHNGKCKNVKKNSKQE